MLKKCQDCRQPLVIQAAKPNALQESFVEVQELQKSEPEDTNQDQLIHNQLVWFFNLNPSVDTKLKIKDMLEHSDKLKLQYPVCFDCFYKILDYLDGKLKEQESDKTIFMKQLAQIEQTIVQQNQTDEQKLLQEIAELEQQEKELDQQLQFLNEQENEQTNILSQLQKDKDRLRDQEDQFWNDVSSYEKNLNSSEDFISQAHQKICNYGMLHKKLEQTSFINEVFQISSSGQFGTISGFRLGKLPDIDVKWDEINAAMGQTIYLLCVIAHRLKFRFEKYSINLSGAYSTIRSVHKPDVSYELYYGTSEEKFNTGMTMMVNCVAQLCSFVSEHYSMYKNQATSKPLFKIDLTTNTINKLSMKYKNEDKETWTKAMKCLLMNMQWLMYVSQIRDTAEQKKGNEKTFS